MENRQEKTYQFSIILDENLYNKLELLMEYHKEKTKSNLIRRMITDLYIDFENEKPF